MKHSFKDFLPLIVIVSIIVVLTGITGSVRDADAMTYMRYFMSFFFLVFGGFKLVNLKNFAKAYREYDLLAKKSMAYSFLYPFIEVGLGIFYLVNIYSTQVNAVTLVLMLFSAAGVYSELRKKKEIVCACLGMVFKLPMTKVTLGEDLLMAVMAGVMLFV